MHQNEIVEYFAQHYEGYLRFAVAITRNHESAQDVLQTVALTMCEKADALSHIENFGGYLTVCVRRAALTHIRQATRSFATDPVDLVGIRAPDSQIAQSYIEWVLVLEKHLARYSVDLRKAFVAFYLDGYALEQVAAQVGLSVNALSQQFKRMRARLGEQTPSLSTLIMILSSL